MDSDTYKTVKHFADECVRIKPLRGFFKNKKLRKKFKKVKLSFCFASLCNQESCLFSKKNATALQEIQCLGQHLSLKYCTVRVFVHIIEKEKETKKPS